MSCLQNTLVAGLCFALAACGATHESIAQWENGANTAGSNGPRSGEDLRGVAYTLPEAPFDLREVVELASERAFNVRIAAEDLEIARAEAEEARRAWWPRLTVGLTYDRLDGATQATLGDFPEVEKQALGLGGAFNLSLDTAQAFYGTRAANLDARASELSLDSIRFRTVLSAARLFADIELAQRRLEIATEAVAQANALEQWVSQRVDQRAALNADLERVRARSAQALRDEIEAGILVDAARGTLANLLDLDSDAEFLTAVNGDDSRRAHIPESALENVERWLSISVEHPELARRRALSEAATERSVGAEQDWLLPRFELGVAFDEFGDNFSGLDRRERYQASLLWDLDFAQGPRARRAGAVVQRARLELMRTRRRLETGVRLAFDRVHAARKGLPIAEVQVTAARAAYNLALERQNQGRGLLIDSLDALFEVRRAELGLATAASGLERAELDLLLASGTESLSVLSE